MTPELRQHIISTVGTSLPSKIKNTIIPCIRQLDKSIQSLLLDNKAVILHNLCIFHTAEHQQFNHKQIKITPKYQWIGSIINHLPTARLEHSQIKQEIVTEIAK